MLYKFRILITFIALLGTALCMIVIINLDQQNEVFGCSENYTAMDIRIFKDTPVWELAKAVRDQDVEEIYSLIKYEKYQVDYKDPKYSSTLLMLATYNNWYSSAKALLENGADPNTTNRQGDNSILLAAGSNNGNTSDTLLLELIVKFKGNVNFVRPINEIDQREDTPLVNAANNSLPKVKMLIEHGADINYYKVSDNLVHSNPLLKAIMFIKIDIVNYLLKHGSNCKLILGYYENGDTLHYVNLLREWRFPLNSVEYKEKMALVKYFKDSCGQDYFKTPIPREMYQGYDSAYIEKY